MTETNPKQVHSDTIVEHEMTTDMNRMQLLLKIASEYIEKHAPLDEIIVYDDAECDGYCLVDDIRAVLYLSEKNDEIDAEIRNAISERRKEGVK